MKISEKSNMAGLVLWCILLLIGLNTVNTLSYDYTASIECLASPQRPQYNGGVIRNPELNEGLKGWSTFGDAKIEHRKLGNNNFIVANSRVHSYDSVSQNLYLQKNKIYTFSAWIQVSKGRIPVSAVFKTQTGYVHAGAIFAESNCWSMLKGGLAVDASGPAQLYFESNNTLIDIWVDSISLQPFTKKQWMSHQDQAIEKTRKTKVRIQAVDSQGKPLSNANISIKLKKASFPFGCAINKNILYNNAYQKWFTSRFTVTVFEDEMKWYSTEPSQGKVDYSVPDAMLQFAKKNNVIVRGHNVFWDDPKYQQGWINSLSPTDLSKATTERINSIMSRYRGQVIGWDVVNENLHFNFFERKLGQNASAVFYNLAQKIDGTSTLFLNDYNTIEDGRDDDSTPAKYLQKLRDIKAFPGNGNLKLGIGLESHFSSAAPNLAYMRASIDTLAATNFPIWLTEVDVQSGPYQAQYLEQILREGHSHPKVAGIVIWSAWKPQGCYRMCLTDNNFKNLPTGDVVDKLLARRIAVKSLAGRTDGNGFFEASLSHGVYSVKIHHPSAKKFSLVQKLNVVSSTGAANPTLLMRFAT
ncbi:hypothetical protein P3X46_013715 [Hevea brasiliensis]|uniref:GH10 domain-containing protein n=1 Tax=Hevea brasiliensis TaxID=3981 RepID=A0ABQ9M893_HEVBR|nr:endo-1,4-beta-xylanase 5-like [Hevea brasiliensis]XP_058007390.1 endo-1,4-beta-xylanase 5-like [Hevea brasiliensis]XP_058007391.1 endo-1,4-beta-xylanase 5-like [Hevea brasiliensis]KAJ9175133.1 hypothetical protein P3X46_013715 [Hevea brasiliensis]KAJ9175134.1 hypothetical protein P3X46_013715 [Hevea brasiliensis]